VIAPSPAAGWRDWLLAAEPKSRAQAKLGQAYLGWLAFRRNPLAMLGLGIILALLLVAAFAPWIAGQSPIAQDLAARLQEPSGEHLFGTDELGRDIFARVVWGARITLTIVAMVVVTVAPLGLVVGTAAGYFGGWFDAVLMRITDIFLAFPRLILALAFVAALGPGIENAVIAIVGAKEEGAKTVALADGRKLTVTGKLTYSADMAQLLSLVTALPKHLSPIKLVHQLDATGAKWLRANDPENWAKIAPAITVKPAKTAVEVK